MTTDKTLNPRLSQIHAVFSICLCCNGCAVENICTDAHQRGDNFPEENNLDQGAAKSSMDAMGKLKPLECNHSSGSDDAKNVHKDWKSSQVAAGFASLKNSPPELCKVCAVKFLDSCSHFGFSLIFALFLSSNFGCSDVKAGTICGMWGAVIMVCGLCAVLLVDNFGVLKSLKMECGVSLLAQCRIFLTTSCAILLVHI